MPVAPLVSILTPIYNSARYLAQTLDSILAQTFSDWECILIDDGSKDESLEIARRYAAGDPRFQVTQQKNQGPSAARNLGYKLIHPNTEFVTFMDSDDVWTPDALNTLIDALRQDTAAVAANGVAEYIDGQGNIIRPGERRQEMLQRIGLRGDQLQILQPHELTTFDALFTGSANFPPGVVLTRRHDYDLIGGFDETLKGPEDWDVLVRLSRQGHIVFVDRVILFYRRHENNLGAASFVANQARDVMRKTYHSPENTPEQQRIVRLMWRLHQADLRRKHWRICLDNGKQRNWKKAARSLFSVAIATYRQFTPPPKR